MDVLAENTSVRDNSHPGNWVLLGPVMARGSYLLMLEDLGLSV